MSELRPAAALPFAYRQRLTTIGWWGAFLAIVMPALTGVFCTESIASAAEATSATLRGLSYSAYKAEANATTYALSAAATAIASAVGMVMLLIGREHYPVNLEG